jgi:hypothetical protein
MRISVREKVIKKYFFIKKKVSKEKLSHPQENP